MTKFLLHLIHLLPIIEKRIYLDGRRHNNDDFMLFCQFGRAHSLREICGGLASYEGKLKHLGVSDAPKRSTLSYANANRPLSLYQTVFEQLLSKCQLATAGHGKRKKFRFKNRLVRLDSSVIDLSRSLFDWAQFRRTKGAVKLHLLLDHDGYLPSYLYRTSIESTICME
jgi:hypothetical protein